MVAEAAVRPVLLGRASSRDKPICEACRDFGSADRTHENVTPCGTETSGSSEEAVPNYSAKRGVLC